MTGPPVILPPFARGDRPRKVKAAQDAWNTRDPQRVALAYTEDSRVAQPRRVLQGARGDRRLPAAQVGPRAGLQARKELWASTGDRIAVRFEYEGAPQRADGGAPTATRWEFDPPA